MTKTERAELAGTVEDFLVHSQENGTPVHVGTSRSSWVHVGYLVHTARNGEDRAELVQTGSGERFSPRLVEISFLATIDGRVWSRATRKTGSGKRREAVSTALSGVASLLAEPDLSPQDRAGLERVAAQLAAQHA